MCALYLAIDVRGNQKKRKFFYLQIDDVTKY